MKVISSVGGNNALYEEATLKANLLPFKDWNADNTYYGDIADEINAGIRLGGKIHWSIQDTMLEYIQDKATIKDVVEQLTRIRIVWSISRSYHNYDRSYLSEELCKTDRQMFYGSNKSDAALISLGKWIKGNGKEQNMAGVNGKTLCTGYYGK